MAYYPDQRYIAKQMTIRRHVMLPEEALGTVRTQQGKRVDQREVVAQGTIPSHHVVLNGAEYFRLKKPDSLLALMLVKEGDAVDVLDVLAGRSRIRGRRLLSPVSGIVAKVIDGRIIIQQTPDLIDLQAGAQGRVIEVHAGRGIVVETMGALIQGVWGNGKYTIATLRMEPEEGMEHISSDQLDKPYGGSVVVTARQLKSTGLRIMEDQGIAGIIAPSMDADLRGEVMETKNPVMLTEGFGAMRLNNQVQTILAELEGRSITLDAFTPDRWDTRRPEAIINVKPDQQRPPGANPLLTVRPDLTVRVTRAPYAGVMGRVLDLPKTPSLLDNGLRVPCALVELVTGETPLVPLADLEFFGKTM